MGSSVWRDREKVREWIREFDHEEFTLIIRKPRSCDDPMMKSEFNLRKFLASMCGKMRKLIRNIPP